MDLIDTLRPLASAVAGHIKDHHGRHGNPQDFRDWRGHFDAADWIDGTAIEYRIGRWASVRLTSIGVSRVASVVIGPVQPGPKTPVRSNLNRLRNDSDQTLKRTITITDAASLEDSTSMDVGVAVALGFRQMISYGSSISPASGETEITASVSSEFKKHWETHRMQSFTVESGIEYECPPHSEVHFDRMQEVGPATQLITVRGELACGVRIWSDKDWTHTWPTIGAMRANFEGLDSGHNWALDFYRDHPAPADLLAQLNRPIEVVIEHERHFEDVAQVDIDFRVTPLSS